MKITIQATGGRPFELAGHGDTSPSNLRVSGETTAEVAEFLRAETVDVFDRGNRRTSLTFSVIRTHNTVETAQVFMLLHEVNVPRRGLVTIESESAKARLWIYDAVVTIVSSSHIGITTLHEYTVMGGAVSNVNPNTLRS